jgi:mono/diheme cytochrome c family protein
MKFAKHISAVAVLAIGLASCSEYSKDPGRVYMPDMSYSRAYEFYSDNPNYANGITAQAPVKGTVARGAALPDHLVEGDSNAFKALRYEGQLSMAQIEEGGRIYNIHCGVCHGTNLDGNGPLYNGGAGKYPAAPANFKDPKYLNMPAGTMYHAIMYGKNLMGAYASQLDYKQRWAVLAYIKKVQAENGGSALTSSFTIGDAPAATTTTTSASTTATEAKGDMKPAETSKKDVVEVIKEAAKSTKDKAKEEKKK